MIHWGIIGAGNIANRFATSLEQVEGATLFAVARRTMEKAEAFKREHPCEVAYDNYQDLLDDSRIDAVYIALPHKYHLEWVEKALKAGKAVLCEKPATLSLAEMKQISKTAQEEGIFFMEAMKSRFVPAYREIRARIQNGEIGEVTQVSTSLCRVFNESDSSYHFEPVQGGCLLDMGVYNLSVIEDFLSTPVQLKELDSEVRENGVEVYVNATLESNGVVGIIESAFDRETETIAVITGTKGTIKMPNFHRPTSYELTLNDTNQTQHIEVPYEVDDFYSEIKHVVDCLNEGVTESSIMSLQHSENIATIVDQLKSAIKSNQY